ARRRLREPHEPSRGRSDARVTRWDLGDGIPLPVRRHAVLEQGRSARGQSLRDGGRRERAPRRAWAPRALGGGSGLPHRGRMSPRADLAIRGAIVIQDGAFARDILVTGGRIAALVESGAASAEEEIDASGMLALPGIVDAHVHFNDPGRADWEGWARGSRAAAAGGTTTVIDMPLNSLPPVLDGPSFDAKRAAGERTSVVDFALWGGIVRADPVALGELAERGAVGVKGFMCESGVPELPALPDGGLVAAMRAAADAGLLVALHAEDSALVAEATARVRAAGRRNAAAWAESRPPLVEVRAVARACTAAREAAARLHIVHLAAVEALGAVGATRRAAGTLDARKIAGFVAWRLATKPAKRFGLWPRKGALVPGADADVVLFDPAREWTLDAEDSLTGGISPYVGRRFRGAVVRT